MIYGVQFFEPPDETSSSTTPIPPVDLLQYADGHLAEVSSMI